MGLLTKLIASLPPGAITVYCESGMQNRDPGEEDGLNRNISIAATSWVLFWVPESGWRYFGITERQGVNKREVNIPRYMTKD